MGRGTARRLAGGEGGDTMPTVSSPRSGEGDRVAVEGLLNHLTPLGVADPFARR